MTAESGTPPEPEGARPGLVDLLRLAAGLAGAVLRPGGAGDPGAVGCRWARALMEREGAGSLDLPVPGGPVGVVGRRECSEAILSGAPDRGGAPPGSLKEEAMGFLAPAALTVAHGRDWRRLRRFNERVLEMDGDEAFTGAVLRAVRDAFAEPIRDLDDVRERMGRAMVAIVVGPVEPEADPAEDARILFDVVQSPLRRKVLGFLYSRRRDRLFGILERALDAPERSPPTLLSRAREAGGDLSREEILQQVPHWMFTFTGSGTDLLGRTLALVTARPQVLDRLVAEVESAGPPDDPATVEGLSFLEACLRETGRLFPPVTRTFHRAEGEEGGELVHWFPLLQRDPTLGESVDAFHPDRWTGSEPDGPARASNLFLRGPRACPGESLILFVCKAALARRLEGGSVESRESRLSRDPLPVSFPDGEIRFQIQGDR